MDAPLTARQGGETIRPSSAGVGTLIKEMEGVQTRTRGAGHAAALSFMDAISLGHPLRGDESRDRNATTR